MVFISRCARCSKITLVLDQFNLADPRSNNIKVFLQCNRPRDLPLVAGLILNIAALRLARIIFVLRDDQYARKTSVIVVLVVRGMNISSSSSSTLLELGPTRVIKNLRIWTTAERLLHSPPYPLWWPTTRRMGAPRPWKGLGSGFLSGLLSGLGSGVLSGLWNCVSSGLKIGLLRGIESSLLSALLSTF